MVFIHEGHRIGRMARFLWWKKSSASLPGARVVYRHSEKRSLPRGLRSGVNLCRLFYKVKQDPAFLDLHRTYSNFSLEDLDWYTLANLFCLFGKMAQGERAKAWSILSLF